VHPYTYNVGQVVLFTLLGLQSHIYTYYFFCKQMDNKLSSNHELNLKICPSAILKPPCLFSTLRANECVKGLHFVAKSKVNKVF
jgi:hypothetical protein